MVTTASIRKLLAPCLAAAWLTGCNLVPVTPWVQFTPYQTPTFDHTDFEQLLQSWKMGRAVNWEVRFKGSSFSEQELLISSTGQCSLGPRLPTAGQSSRTFTATNTDLSRVVDKLIDSGVFTLYDGHYGAYSQGGGAGGPDLTVTVNDLIKHVSKDDGLSPSWSRESGIIDTASNAVADLALQYIKQ